MTDSYRFGSIVDPRAAVRNLPKALSFLSDAFHLTIAGDNKTISRDVAGAIFPIQYQNSISGLFPLFAGLSFLAGLALYYLLSPKGPRRVYLGILSSTIVIYLVLISTVTLLHPYYLIPIYSLAMLAIAEVIVSLFPRGKVFLFGKLLVVGLMTWTLYSNFTFALTITNYDSIPSSILPVLKEEIIAIKRREQYPGLDFFQIGVYGKEAPEGDHEIDAPFWILLEREFGVRFTKNSDVLRFNYEQLNADAYIFLVCQYYAQGYACLDKFSKTHSSHVLIKEIYRGNDLIIYVTRKTVASFPQNSVYLKAAEKNYQE
ncbi:MAG: hypothetical protein HY006_02430 [Candidatus Sungbacteria bacterium]|nr:hypothetical protein [Candidatus Sungbacteria bacterium]